MSAPRRSSGYDLGVRALLVGAAASLAFVTGCDQVFGLSRPPEPPPPPQCVRDDFDDGLIDSTTWRIVTPGNAPIVIAETNQQLRFLHPMRMDGFNALETVRPYDITGGYVQIELSEPPTSATNIDTNLLVILDDNNYYMLNLANSRLTARITTNGVIDNKGVMSEANDRHWRIRHDADTDEIVFELSEKIEDWSELRREPASVPVTAVRVRIAGDSFGGGPLLTDATAGWDNLELLAPSCK